MYTVNGLEEMGIARLRLLVACILWVMCWSGQKANGQSVGLTLNSMNLTNNSIVTNTDIGTGAAALVCTTTYTPCCTSFQNPETQWYFPNGYQVPNNPSLPYQRTRGQNPGRVILNRNSESTITGIFRCDIPDASGVIQSLYVGIYTGATGGQVRIAGAINFRLETEPTTDPPVFTLTCTSTGGPATTVSWTRDGNIVTANSNRIITSQVTDTVAATYVHTLRVIERQLGPYTCSVSNSRTSLAAATTLQVAAAGQPGNLHAWEYSSIRIRVTWTAPTSGATVTGYRIYWSGGSDQGSMNASAGDTAVTFTGCTCGLVYTITIVAVSNQLPSEMVNITLGVDLTLNGRILTNNSIVTNADIGTGSAALACTTTYTSCCTIFGNPETQWYFPNGSLVPNHQYLPYQRTRGTDPGRVILHRNFESTITGIFRCDIPDACGDIQHLYVGIYTITTGQATIPGEIKFQLDSELNANTPVFTLTCTSTGGPASTVSWTRGSTMLSGTSQIVTNMETGTYMNMLRVAMREVGVYMCTVSNSRSSDTRSLTVVEANPPTILNAVRVSPTSIRVSWTAPASEPTVLGYHVFWTDGNNMDSAGVGASETDHTITIPQPQNSSLNYSFTIVALSTHLPSTVVGPALVTVDPALTPGAATPTSVVVSWSQQAGVDSYEILFHRATGNQQLGDCTSFEHSSNVSVDDNITMYNVTGLQEFSTYIITVIAVINVRGRSQNNPITVNTQMAAPSGSPQSLREVETTSTNVTIAWDAVNCTERNSNITGYVVRFTPPSTSGNDSVMVAGTGDAGGMVTIDGLTPSTQYSIQVAAVNSDGNIGVFTTALSVQTALGAIPGLVNSLSISTLVLVAITWAPPLMPDDDIIAYEVSYQGEDGGQEVRNVTATSVELTGLRPESTYTISVRAYTAAGPGMERILTVPATIASTSQALVYGSLAGAVVGACIGTALLYTVVLLVVKFARNKRHREVQNRGDDTKEKQFEEVQNRGDDTKGTVFENDIVMKECIAYGGVAVNSSPEDSDYEETPK